MDFMQQGDGQGLFHEVWVGMMFLYIAGIYPMVFQI